MANYKSERGLTERNRPAADEGDDISYLAWRRGMAGQDNEVVQTRSATRLQHA